MSNTQTATSTVIDHDPISRAIVDLMREADPEVADVLVAEADRQSSTRELIASENHVTGPVMHAVGTWMTNKYAEGYLPSGTTVGASTTTRSRTSPAAPRSSSTAVSPMSSPTSANANIAAFMAAGRATPS